jgi:DNA (cytosine-5)-methyltransferase 1
VKFGSVCSGIEAASVAWESLGWKAAWFSEIEPFPCAVLKHHYPDVPNHGDMTTLPDRILSGEVEAPDVFCGGTPCQAFSVAGNRKSLDDARGNLSLTFCEIANAIDSVRHDAGKRPAVIFWENVPGCRNTKDNFFGCFLAELCGATEALEIEKGKWPTSGLVVGERRRVAWATLDARWFGLAQRRKRVFVVAYDNALVEHFGVPCPSKILSLGNGLPRNFTESGKARKGITADAQSGTKWPADVACTLNAAFGSKQGLEDQHINGGAPLFVPAICFENSRRDGVRIYDGVSNTLQSFMGTGGGNTPCVTYGMQSTVIGRSETSGPQGMGFCEEVSYTLTKADQHGVVVAPPPCVQDSRRLRRRR